uniref:Uncharacterized protein n=1 Tax=candidate division WOR-3 bacterium TaxID=2052148 RepID=A0A7C4UC43_UNCW3
MQDLPLIGLEAVKGKFLHIIFKEKRISLGTSFLYEYSFFPIIFEYNLWGLNNDTCTGLRFVGSLWPNNIDRYLKTAFLGGYLFQKGWKGNFQFQLTFWGIKFM